VHGSVITGLRYADHLHDAGFTTRVIPNQGKGAAMQRIEALRRLFPKLYFDEERCAPGIAALEHYHAKIDEDRQFSTAPSMTGAVMPQMR
jgi:phage terminase large subunit